MRQAVEHALGILGILVVLQNLSRNNAASRILAPTLQVCYPAPNRPYLLLSMSKSRDLRWIFEGFPYECAGEGMAAVQACAHVRVCMCEYLHASATCLGGAM